MQIGIEVLNGFFRIVGNCEGFESPGFVFFIDLVKSAGADLDGKTGGVPIRVETGSPSYPSRYEKGHWE